VRARASPPRGGRVSRATRKLLSIFTISGNFLTPARQKCRGPRVSVLPHLTARARAGTFYVKKTKWSQNTDGRRSDVVRLINNLERFRCALPCDCRDSPVRDGRWWRLLLALS
jgi:hypothetical protein